MKQKLQQTFNKSFLLFVLVLVIGGFFIFLESDGFFGTQSVSVATSTTP
ncbi:MAG TPA: hypothetical protein VMR73_00425 [Candidatus Paceibacterota bacterium]|nr:hypothetical protein [Candidatus Paceibacterota bacterium]